MRERSKNGLNKQNKEMCPEGRITFIRSADSRIRITHRELSKLRKNGKKSRKIKHCT